MNINNLAHGGVLLESSLALRLALICNAPLSK
jgi:hypothetical protein